MTLSCSPAQLSPALATQWVAGDALGVSRQRIHQLYQKLAPLGAARKDGSVYLFQRSHPAMARYIARAARDRAMGDLSDCTERQRTDALRKERFCRQALTRIPEIMSQRGVGRTVAVEWFCREQGLAVKSFRRWESLHRTGGVRALVDTRGGKLSAAETFTPEAWEHCKALWLDDRKWSARLCYELTAAKAEQCNWLLPSYRTVCKRLAAIPRAVKILAREGNKAYESQCAPRDKRDRSVIPAGDHYCGDEMTHDFYCRAPDGKGGWKRIRPILTAWECERSRAIVGYRIADRANADTILAAFKMALREWGVPRAVTIDNGHDYTASAGVNKRTKRSAAEADRVASVFTDLEISTHFAIPYNPQSKLIESFFKTAHERFDKLFDSYCGGSPDTRPEGANSIPLHQLPTVEDIEAAFGKWLADFYHLRPHSGDGMFGYSPVQAWEHFRSPEPRAPIDGDRLDLLCSRYVGPVTVSTYGVRHRGLQYEHAALMDMIGEKVWIRLDPDRADQVHVCDFANKRYICTAAAAELAGVSQSHVRDRQRAKARRKKVVKEYLDTRHVDLDDSVDGVLRAKLAWIKSHAEDLRNAPPAERVQLVRPDIKADVIAASKRVNQALEPSSSDDDNGDVYSILAAQADQSREREEADVCDTDDDAIGFEAFADAIPFEPITANDGGDESADGFAALADCVLPDAPEVRRYGAA